MSQAPVLQCYDVTKLVVIQRDSSGKGHGAVLLQDSKPVCYAPLALTDAETRHAPIEAEMVAAVFVCHKFHQYIYHRSTIVETDHKPLQAISKKNLVTSSIETLKDDPQSAWLLCRSPIHSWK